MYLYKVGTWSGVLINQVSCLTRCPYFRGILLRMVPTYSYYNELSGTNLSSENNLPTF